MSKVVFLTFNDYPGGIFSGQVVDVCKHLTEHGSDVELVSFVSLRSYFKTTAQIKSQYPRTTTLFMSPGVANWKKNIGRLRRRIAKINPDTIIARGPFATWLAIACRDAGLVKRVVFDGRGAYEAEFKEYNVAQSDVLNAEVRSVEEIAVTKSDFRIAVSDALVSYWREEFGYSEMEHVVIPCTLRKAEGSTVTRNRIRQQLGYSSSDIVVVYSGSFAGWQSFDLIDQIGGKLFERNPAVKFLILATGANELKIAKQYPDRVSIKWLRQEEVAEVLSACDYGWLVREDSVTNRVASPVKFAEYLNAGIPVLISPRLGDFSLFTQQHNCGHLITDELPELVSLTEENRTSIQKLATAHFLKSKYVQQYKRVVG